MSALTVLFDLDGTLTDSRAGITASIRHALARLGRACPGDEVLATYIGPPLRGTLSTLLGTTDPALIDTALGHYRARYDEVGLYESRVYDGVPEMLEATDRGGGELFVATAKTRHAATRIVAHFALARHFRAVYGAEPGGRFDRKVDLLAHLLETGVIRAETSVMVGDRGLDVAAAKANGLRAVGALWGFGDARELAQAGADLLCESPRALPERLAPITSLAESVTPRARAGGGAPGSAPTRHPRGHSRAPRDGGRPASAARRSHGFRERPRPPSPGV